MLATTALAGRSVIGLPSAVVAAMTATIRPSCSCREVISRWSGPAAPDEGAAKSRVTKEANASKRRRMVYGRQSDDRSTPVLEIRIEISHEVGKVGREPPLVKAQG